MTTHWTDDATPPFFSTRLRADNVFVTLGQAISLLRQLDVPRDRIDALKAAVLAAPSYDAALALIGRWFPVDCDDGDQIP